MTINEDAPRRLTKGRASALLEIFDRGVERERQSLEQEYAIRFNHDGTIDLSDDSELIAPGDLQGLPEALETLADAMAAASIIRRRYL